MTRDNNLCPECSGPMISRLNSQTQQRFWGCKRFPECRGTRDTDGRSRQEREYTGEDEGDDFHPGHPRWYGNN